MAKTCPNCKKSSIVLMLFKCLKCGTIYCPSCKQAFMGWGNACPTCGGSKFKQL